MHTQKTNATLKHYTSPTQHNNPPRMQLATAAQALKHNNDKSNDVIDNDNSERKNHETNEGNNNININPMTLEQSILSRIEALRELKEKILQE